MRSQRRPPETGSRQAVTAQPRIQRSSQHGSTQLTTVKQGSSSHPQCHEPMREPMNKPWNEAQKRVSKNVSVASATNERYTLAAPSSHDHDNEDEYLVDESSDSSSVYLCVLDGHDGRNAVEFVKKYLWNNHLAISRSENPEDAIQRCIRDADTEYFKNLDHLFVEKLTIQMTIPKGMKSYEAHITFPIEVARLQQLESQISGGCTAVVAVVKQDVIYVANVGDSRAILVYETSDGALQVSQLSEDHDVQNEGELKRLSKLGLDRRELKKSGRLGTQENTRSIGDYSIKGGFRDVDVISHATSEPGIAEPHVTTVEINDKTFKYLILMSDGVYKTVMLLQTAAGHDGKARNENEMVAYLVDNCVKEGGIQKAASNVLKQIDQDQYHLYQKSARKDARSPAAVANRKRDDMTLVVYQFNITH